MIRIEPGQDTSDGTVAHAGEECGLVLRGTLEVQVGQEVYALEEGDSICFESSVPHRLRNLGMNDGES
ncbi:MAG: cupin domain-containing protein [Firmicutes bacterium]|nr:cupin domain-containing protein [Bacillota bacterium]